jgi:hypothetical protein
MEYLIKFTKEELQQLAGALIVVYTSNIKAEEMIEIEKLLKKIQKIYNEIQK